MRAYPIHLIVILALLPVFAACGDDPGTTTVPTEGARLVAISDLTQVIRFGARTDMTVRYEQGDGSLVTGAILDWEVDGFAPEAVLAAGQSTTDGAGESTVGLTAGMVASTFIVRVTPPVGDALEFQIAITDEDSGSIRVDLAYTGTAAFDAFEAGLFEGMTCADLTDPGSLPTALIGSTVTSIRESPGFVPVAVGSTYMVAVQAKESGATTGFGCVDGISVTDQRETRVDVTISDIEILLIVEGVYEVTNLLDFGSGLPGSVTSTIDILDELTDDTDINGNVGTMDFGQDPGAFVVDFAMRQTCGWECLAGEDYDSCSVINHRQGDISALYIENFRSWSGAEAAFFGGCGAWEDAAIPAQNLVNTQVSMAIPDSITMFGVVAGDLARAINSAQFESRLTVDQPADGAATFIHELLDMTVTLHNLAGVESTYTFDVLDAGLASRPRSSDTMIMVTGNQVELPMHGFDINFGLLIRYIYVNGILPLLGYTSSAEMLNDWIDCDSIGTSLESSVGLLSAMEYADACRTGLTSAGTFLDVGLDGVIDLDGVMTLQGTATAGDPLPDGTATTLNGGIWMGGWSEDMGATSGDIDGTWTGTRRP